jgi:hypothetical protein
MRTMKRRMLGAGCFALLWTINAQAQGANGVATAMSETVRPSEQERALIGTWRLMEFADLDKEGKWTYQFGEHPRGYVVYDGTGHVHIQIMKVPALPRFPEASVRNGTLAFPRFS